MVNYDAQKINKKLGFTLFNESNIYRLELKKFTKKQIKYLMIDDLINPETKKGTLRLSKLVREILFTKD